MTQGRRIGLLSMVIFALSGISTPGLAENTIVFGVTENLPPFAFEDNGVAKGFFIDVFQAAARRAGFDPGVKLYPFKRLRAGLETGDIDGDLAIYYQKARTRYLVYTKTPVLVSQDLVFVKKGRAFPFNAISDLFGKRIGVMTGWKLNNTEMEKAVKEGKILLDPADEFNQNLKKLMSERVDCLVTGQQLTWYHANKMGIARNIVALDHPLAEARVYFAVSKKSKNIPHPQAFINQLDTALNDMLADGTHGQLLRRYKLVSMQSSIN